MCVCVCVCEPAMGGATGRLVPPDDIPGGGASGWGQRWGVVPVGGVMVGGGGSLRWVRRGREGSGQVLAAGNISSVCVCVCVCGVDGCGWGGALGSQGSAQIQADPESQYRIHRGGSECSQEWANPVT